MSDERRYHQLRELGWRRELDANEKAELRSWLVAHPEAVQDWEADSSLTEILQRLPDVPLASNFTAQVLGAVALETAAASRRAPKVWRGWHFWLPRAAFAGVVFSAGVFSYHLLADVRQQKMVRSVAAVSDVVSLPSPDILENFDAIRVLDRTPPDEDLLRICK